MDENPRNSRLAQLAELDDGWALSAEFFSAVLVWTGLGWFGDRWLGTDPWLVVSGAVLGFILGIYLVWVRATHTDD